MSVAIAMISSRRAGQPKMSTTAIALVRGVIRGRTDAGSNRTFPARRRRRRGPAVHKRTGGGRAHRVRGHDHLVARADRGRGDAAYSAEVANHRNRVPGAEALTPRGLHPSNPGSPRRHRPISPTVPTARQIEDLRDGTAFGGANARRRRNGRAGRAPRRGREFRGRGAAHPSKRNEPIATNRPSLAADAAIGSAITSALVASLPVHAARRRARRPDEIGSTRGA